MFLPKVDAPQRVALSLFLYFYDNSYILLRKYHIKSHSFDIGFFEKLLF